MKEKKFRALSNNKIIYQKETGNYGLMRFISRLFENSILMQWSGLQDSKGVDIYEGDIVYLAGYGDYDVEFPFIELYEAGMENDIGEILGNVYEGLN